MAGIFVLKNGKLEGTRTLSYAEVRIVRKDNGEKDKEMKGEDLLQWLVAESSDGIIPWEQIGVDEEEISVVTVKREAGVTPGSADVLLLGSDKILTIVEAKLSENRREIRRMLIGQAIEYAAHLQSEWDSVRVKEEGEKWWREEQKEKTFLSAVRDELKVDDEDEFWAEVDKNLSEGVIRIIYACDEIPREVRQTIEFLNRFSGIEIYGLELQLHSTAGEILVSGDLIGPSPTDKAQKEKRKPKGERGRIWTEQEFLAQAESESGEKGLAIAKDLLEFGKHQPEVSNPFYSPSRSGSAIFKSGDINLFTLYPSSLYVTAMSRENTRTLAIDWNDVLNKLKEAGLRRFDTSDIGHSRTVPFSDLSEKVVEGFKRLTEWFVDMARKESAD